jgi:hypothetical protein
MLIIYTKCAIFREPTKCCFSYKLRFCLSCGSKYAVRRSTCGFARINVVISIFSLQNSSITRMLYYLNTLFDVQKFGARGLLIPCSEKYLEFKTTLNTEIQYYTVSKVSRIKNKPENSSVSKVSRNWKFLEFKINLKTLLFPTFLEIESFQNSQ